MNSLTSKLVKQLRVTSDLSQVSSSLANSVSQSQPSASLGLRRSSRLWYSNSRASFNNDDANEEVDTNGDFDDDAFLPNKKDLEPQGVDPQRGWGFRGVHKVFVFYSEWKLF